MKDFYKIITMILCVLFILTGCSKSPITITQEAVKTLKISYDENDIIDFPLAQKVLSEKLWEISENKITAEFNSSVDSINDIFSDKAHIAITPLKNLNKYGNKFEILNSPFYFNNALNSTQILNSVRFKSIMGDFIKEKTGCNLMYSLFNDATFLASDYNILTNLSDLKKNNIYISEEKADIINFLKSYEIPYITLSKDNYYELTGENYIAFEVSLKDFSPNSSNISANSIFVYDKPIFVNSLWVLEKSNLSEYFSPKEIDIIRKAFTFFNAEIEDDKLYDYSEIQYQFYNENMRINLTNGSDLQNAVQNYYKFNKDKSNEVDIDLYNDILNIIK